VNGWGAVSVLIVLFGSYRMGLIHDRTATKLREEIKELYKVQEYKENRVNTFEVWSYHNNAGQLRFGIYPRSQIRMEIICRSNDKHFAPEWKEFGSTWGVSDIDCPPAGRKKNHPLDGGDAYFKKKKVRVK